jgi:hypothetical protein
VLINGVAGVLNAAGNSVIDNRRQSTHLGSFGNFVPTSLHRYNSLQASLVHRFSHNLQAQVSYTYSKCMDDGSYLGSFNSNAPAGLGNPYNQSYDWGLCPYDITHVLTINGLYALPFHGNRVVEGWQISGVLSAATTGTPLTILDGIDATGFGSAVSRHLVQGVGDWKACSQSERRPNHEHRRHAAPDSVCIEADILTGTEPALGDDWHARGGITFASLHCREDTHRLGAIKNLSLGVENSS